MAGGATTVVEGIGERPVYDYQLPDIFFDAAPPSGPGVYNVLDYGAVADSGVDNRAMIQAAIDAAHDAGGGIVYIPAGVYGLEGADGIEGALQVRSNVFLKGDGMGETVLRLVDGSERDVTGIVRSPWGEATTNWGVGDLTIDGNLANTTGQVDGFFTGPAPDLTIRDADVYVNRVEVMHVSRYGFDPHEQTERLSIVESVSHDNGVDGFTIDFVSDSEFIANEAYGNGRHGFNIVTQSSDLVLLDNIAYDNAGAGIVVQRGGSDIPSPHTILIAGGGVYDNGREGVLIQMAHDVTIESVEASGNGMSGVRLLGADNVSVISSLIDSNSQVGPDQWSEVQIQSYDDAVTGTTFAATGNLVDGNFISSDGDAGARYLIEERAGAFANSVGDNVLQGGVRGDVTTIDEFGGNVMYGTDDADDLSGSGNTDTITAADGDDIVYGRSGDDVLSGDAGNDALYGGKGDDRLYGGTGDDALSGNTGDDTLFGQSGNDSISGDAGNDVINGGDGNDVIFGGSGDDVIFDGSGDDTVSAGSNDDTVFAGGGNDIFDGGSGSDTIDFSGFAGARGTFGMQLDVATGTATINHVDAGSTVFSGFEHIIAGDGDDILLGSDGSEILDGGDGDNLIVAGGGDDVLVAGLHSDALEGGAGRDIFRFEAGDVVGDTITDFAHGADRIDLSGRGLTFADLGLSANDGVATITAGAHTITLTNLTDASGLTAADFIL